MGDVHNSIDLYVNVVEDGTAEREGGEDPDTQSQKAPRMRLSEANLASRCPAPIVGKRAGQGRHKNERLDNPAF